LLQFSVARCADLDYCKEIAEKTIEEVTAKGYTSIMHILKAKVIESKTADCVRNCPCKDQSLL
jgi:hypothetical protein